MGYPIHYPLTVQGKSVTIQQAAKLVSNFALSDSITILNRDTRFGGPSWDNEAKGIPDTVRIIQPALTTGLAKDAIPAYLPARDIPGVPVKRYTESSWIGSYRVLIPGKYILQNGSKVQVALAGPPLRSERQSYTLTHITLQNRLNQTTGVTGSATQVTFNGENEVKIGQEGAVSDYVDFNLQKSQDVFLTFYASSAPVYLQRLDDPPVEPLSLTWILGNQDITKTADWGDTKDIQGEIISRPSIYCLLALYVQGQGGDSKINMQSVSSSKPQTTTTTTTTTTIPTTTTTTTTTKSPTHPPSAVVRDPTVASHTSSSGDVQHRAAPPPHEKSFSEKFIDWFHHW